MSRTLTAMTLLFVFLSAACATTQAPTVTVPDKLKPGANESLALIAPAKGVQIYERRARADRAAEYA